MKNTITRRFLPVAVAAITAISVMTGCAAESTQSSSSKSASPAPISSVPVSGAPSLGEISLVSREDGSGTRGAFIELFGIEEKTSDGKKIDHTSTEATYVNKTDVMLQTIAGDPTSIGYLSLGSLNDSVKAVQIDGAVASSENMLSGVYKISRPFNIATKGDATGLAKDFIDFILSAEGQAVVNKSYLAINSKAPAYSGSKPSGKIVVGGSSSVFPAMEKLKEAYEGINPQAVIELQSSDSTAGMTGTIDGIFDIGMASRSLKDSEKKSLKEISIAIDGIAVIVNPKNPIENLSSAEVKAIFTGEVTDWSAIG